MLPPVYLPPELPPIRLQPYRRRRRVSPFMLALEGLLIGVFFYSLAFGLFVLSVALAIPAA